MENLNSISKDEYNSIPVIYCKRCLSLRVRTTIDGVDYCDECGSTDTGKLHIKDWMQKYEDRYGKPYISKLEK